MKKHLKTITLIAAMLMLIGIMSACASGSNTAQQETTTAAGQTNEAATTQAETTQAATTQEATTQAETTTAAPVPQNNGFNSNEGIGSDAALDIALKDAGFSKSDVDNTWVELDLDDGRYEYDVKFYRGMTEYEYTIDANSGSIFEKDIDND